MFRVFKITDAGGKPDSPDLLGLLIIETNQGFFLVDAESQDDHEPAKVLSEAIFNITRPPVSEFNFKFKDLHWTMIVEGVKKDMHGKWINRKVEDSSKQDVPDEEDHWVATGTGTGVPEDDEARAASATY